MAESQTKTVELAAELAKRTRREAERRGITLKEPAASEVERRRAAAERTRGMLADGSGRSVADELIAERREEARAEDREDEARRRRG